MGAPALAPSPSLVDRVTLLLERVDYRRADATEVRDQIYRLRYLAYRRETAIQSNHNKRFSDTYDDLPNAFTFGLYIDDKLASSFRMHVSTEKYSDLPAAHVFPEILKPEIEAGKTIIDPTRFVADADAARLYPELPYATVRLGYLAAEYFSADIVLATVRAEHQAFYKRVFGHRPICPPRPYPTLSKPISLMTLHFPPAREQIIRRYPFFHSTAFERRMLFERQAKVAQRSAA